MFEKEFDEKFKPRCIKCGEHGVNPLGECACSYDVSDKIIEKPEDIKQFYNKKIEELVNENRYLKTKYAMSGRVEKMYKNKFKEIERVINDTNLFFYEKEG